MSLKLIITQFTPQVMTVSFYNINKEFSSELIYMKILHVFRQELKPKWMRVSPLPENSFYSHHQRYNTTSPSESYFRPRRPFRNGNSQIELGSSERDRGIFLEQIGTQHRSRIEQHAVSHLIELDRIESCHSMS